MRATAYREAGRVICFITCGYLPLVIGGIWLALWLYRAYARRGQHRRRRLHAAGRCIRCGYDLRGTPTHCPECGAEVAEQLKQLEADEYEASGG